MVALMGLLRVSKSTMLLLASVMCVILVLFMSTTSRGYCFSSSVDLLATSVTGNDVSSSAEGLKPLPLSAKYHGRPVAEMYQPGFDVDPAKCASGGYGLNVVVVVHSRHGDEVQRMAIRHTWGSMGNRRDADLVFLLGRSLDEELTKKVTEESRAYGDVVVSRNVDSYDNLTLKSVAMTEWISRRCPGPKFFIKADDDMFLNVPRLLELLRGAEASTANRTMFGGLTRGTHPVRDKKHKHCVSKEEYPGDVYLDYLQGPCYMVTGDLSADLYRAALHDGYFRIEDVFLTGLMAERVGARRVDPGHFYAVGFLLKRAREGVLKAVNGADPCELRLNIGTHNINHEHMYRMWHSVHDKKLKC